MGLWRCVRLCLRALCETEGIVCVLNSIRTIDSFCGEYEAFVISLKTIYSIYATIYPTTVVDDVAITETDSTHQTHTHFVYEQLQQNGHQSSFESKDKTKKAKK